MMPIWPRLKMYKTLLMQTLCLWLEYVLISQSWISNVNCRLQSNVFNYIMITRISHSQLEVLTKGMYIWYTKNNRTYRFGCLHEGAMLPCMSVGPSPAWPLYGASITLYWCGWLEGLRVSLADDNRMVCPWSHWNLEHRHHLSCLAMFILRTTSSGLALRSEIVAELIITVIVPVLAVAPRGCWFSFKIICAIYKKIFTSSNVREFHKKSTNNNC